MDRPIVFKTRPELVEAMKLTKLPQLVDLHFAAKICVDGYPDTTTEIVAFPWPQVKVLICVMRNKFTRPFLLFKLINNGTLEDIDNFFGCCPDFLDEFNEIFIYNTDINISAHLSKKLSTKFDFDSSNPCHTNTFYVPFDKQMELADMDIVLPEGFQFCDLDPEIDSELITGTWKHAVHNELPTTKSKLAYLPSVGVKFGAQLVAFEMLCPSGAMSHLYTVPEFRGKGIGTAVELKLCQKLIKLGIWPFKYVELDNTQAVSASEKSGFWLKVMEDYSNSPQVFDFVEACKIC